MAAYRVRQPARGYRVNVDTLLLAATLPRAVIGVEATRVAEPGCGVGAALLAMACRCETRTARRVLWVLRGNPITPRWRVRTSPTTVKRIALPS